MIRLADAKIQRSLRPDDPFGQCETVRAVVPTNDVSHLGYGMAPWTRVYPRQQDVRNYRRVVSRNNS